MRLRAQKTHAAGEGSHLYGMYLQRSMQRISYLLPTLLWETQLMQSKHFSADWKLLLTSLAPSCSVSERLSFNRLH
jgi:hypothetical protein